MKDFRKVIPLLVALACAGVGRADGELPRPYVPDIFRKGETILFIGDSLTDGNHGGDMNHYLGHGFAADIAMRYLGYRPELGLHFANRGKGGENSAEVRARWERDAIPYTPDENGYDAPYPGCKGKPRIPDWLNILVGFNDGWSVKRLKPAELEENLRYMVSTARVANPNMKIVLCDLFWMPDVKMDDDKKARQAIVRRLAKELGLFFVPFEKLFYETLLKEHPVRTWWVWDNVHPTYGAHMRMADEWLSTVAEFRTKGRSKNVAVYPRAKLENDSYNWWERHARILREQKQRLEQLTEALLQHETLNRAEFLALMETGTVPEGLGEDKPRPAADIPADEPKNEAGNTEEKKEPDDHRTPNGSDEIHLD